MPKPITVVDVARSAGVAVGTVSRVLNHHPNVNDAARVSVLKAAQQLGYKRIRHHRRNGSGPQAQSAKPADDNVVDAEVKEVKKG